ncbi:DUF1877 family protein [Streptomyces pyxinae]|uniref:DUF1877 family protein n=1 Tax=Streptomyces pyxinae TaxID=2970734 RepID=UPI002867F743|nr:DUF1877 family protein [Streptomyces sp. LP05-1]
MLRRAGFPVDVVHREAELPGSPDWGHGPPGVLTPDQVRTAAEAFATTTPEALIAEVTPSDLAAARTYPQAPGSAANPWTGQPSTTSPWPPSSTPPPATTRRPSPGSPDTTPAHDRTRSRRWAVRVRWGRGGRAGSGLLDLLVTGRVSDLRGSLLRGADLAFC